MMGWIGILMMGFTLAFAAVWGIVFIFATHGWVAGVWTLLGVIFVLGFALTMAEDQR